MRKITATLINYHHICPRKVWLFSNGIAMEQESEVVQFGKMLDEESYQRKQKEILLESNYENQFILVGKLDWVNLKDGVLHEVKKSRAMESAHEWQLKFYLWLLSLSNIRSPQDLDFVGMLNYPKLKQTKSIKLTKTDIQALTKTVNSIDQLLQASSPPPRTKNKKLCKLCAYEELCFG